MAVSPAFKHISLTSLFVVITFVTSSHALFNCSGSASIPRFICVCSNETMSIECRNSSLASIPADLSPELKRLSIVENAVRIEVLEEILYADLKQLHLNNIGLRYIRSNAFARLAQLETLTLVNNSITTISSETFAGLKSLQMLDLDGNMLYEINEYTFSGAVLPSLSIVGLANCHIYNVQSRAFYQLPNLYKINVGYNFLSEFPDFDDVTANLTNLSKLEMTDNALTSFETTCTRIPTSLEVLILNRNAIEAVTYSSNATMMKPSSLTHLHLRQNRVSKIDTRALSRFRKLEEMDLVSNQLKSIDESDWPWTSLNKVLIYDNPWDCSDCANIWISMNAMILGWNNETGARPLCSTPSQYKDQCVFDVLNESMCGGVKSHTELIVIVLLFLVFSVVAVVLLHVLVKRRRAQRKMSSIKNNTQGPPTTMSYRQMRDMSPFSIDDDEERS